MQLTMSARIDHEEEARVEKLDVESAAAGLSADIVFVYPIEDDDTLKEENRLALENAKNDTGLKASCAKFFGGGAESMEKEQEEQLNELNTRNENRADTIVKMRTVGLTVVKQKTRDGKKMLCKVTAQMKRLEKEAQRLGIEMRLKEDFNDPDRPDVPTGRRGASSRRWSGSG
eukprot:2500060-Prymnesium_polylepis.1